MSPGGALDWASAGRSLPGQTSSGDLAVFTRSEDTALVAVIDGLGHGAAAAEAAALAAEAVRGASEQPVLRIFAECHTRLRGTRGAVMSLAVFDLTRGTVTWAGLGNVEGLLLRASPARPRDGILLRPGVLGSRSPPVRVKTLDLDTGDLVILATDGVRGGLAAAVSHAATVDAIAETLVRTWTRDDDDALVAVARWRAGVA